ncbi:type I-D CRISPR-associated helicase Cas3' [Planktothrix sp. FACHB-1355]|uniref:Type I-D CRISPR-associated helicase Cas3 n=1 Tax=Aerosakkonema funiforme FACHB-1375 TaxID=2949571 RepID=A0A926VJ79_9CYAN|nr:MULTISPECIES: type I-D CRISPR-associated helicase Cas3' [Oscillatoriales]MBD2184618.1 type I-D CRISPR-associated helicase Cas3' [Aerosakkonema funiforme FACHB-1375]MBD3560008.1 type I-D CRISPR-associated helicase Cas3' [Planktothrix sp. FACHB-1355]
MKITLLPLFSKQNTDSEHCALGCRGQCKVKEKAPKFGENRDAPCILSLHQVETCAQVLYGDAEIIFNTSATGDGKSLAAQLSSLIDLRFRTIALYPTIELVTDQEKQVANYCTYFNLDASKRVDSLYGAELARRVEAAEKGNKFKELSKVIERKSVILTNPDIFHLVTHFRYYNPAYDRALLPLLFARNLDLYVADEFHIFGVHQEAAILNSLLLIRYNRPRKRPMKVLFTSATPKPSFIKKLQEAGFKVAEVKGSYESESTPGYRQILQSVELEFVQLDRDSDSLSWLKEQAETIRQILEAEGRGRGLIILNSVAQVSRAVRELQAIFPEDKVKVREISGRIDRQERTVTQTELQNAEQSVLVIGTSAVDVGVDFRIHLLIFEASDSATFIQRLGRLGRHPGFSAYKAFVLLSGRTPWIMARLNEKLAEVKTVNRNDFREMIEDAFDPPAEFERYRAYWGALQAQGMLLKMTGENADVMRQIQAKMTDDLRQVYGEQLDKKRGHWFALKNDATGKAVQEELLRFRGGSDLQAAVWDESRFYTYDLLRLLPYAEVEIIDRDRFLAAATKFNHPATEFPDKYIQVYLKIKEWTDERFDIQLECDRTTEELKQCSLIQLDKLSIVGHPQSEVKKCLRKRKLLAFIVSVNRSQAYSHWDVSRKLHLNPTFGLYRLTDADGVTYATAFNQDALLLEAMKWRLKPCETAKPYIY